MRELLEMRWLHSSHVTSLAWHMRPDWRDAGKRRGNVLGWRCTNWRTHSVESWSFVFTIFLICHGLLVCLKLHQILIFLNYLNRRPYKQTFPP